MAIDKKESYSKPSVKKSTYDVNPGPYVGIVKNNLDPTRSGRLQVYIPALSSGEDDVPENWRTVAYASPFFGSTFQGDANTQNKFDKVNHTYGFWAVPPDVGNFVLCVYTSMAGPIQGYWFACVPNQLGHHMVPGIAGSYNVDDSSIDNTFAKDNYSGVPTVVTEFNENDEKVNWATFANAKKPVHEEILTNLIKQGLDEDYVRGIISSSSQRESPSSVFGISTPGRALNDFGTGEKDKDKIKSGGVSSQDLSTKARKGGHTFVMDDGNWDDKDRLIRLRTSGGHQILMNDSERIMYIGNSDGTVWIELTGPGHLNIYTEQNINIRSAQDINFHADRNININAGENFNLSAKTSANFQSSKININASQSLIEFGGKVGIGSSGAIDINAASTGSFSTGSKLNITGSIINLNTEAGPGVKRPDPLIIKKFANAVITAKGKWKNEPNQFESIVTVAPTHEPWDMHLNTKLAGPLEAINTAGKSYKVGTTTKTVTATGTTSTAQVENPVVVKTPEGAPLSPIGTNVPTPTEKVSTISVPGEGKQALAAANNALDKNSAALNKIKSTAASAVDQLQAVDPRIRQVIKSTMSKIPGEVMSGVDALAAGAQALGDLTKIDPSIQNKLDSLAAAAKKGNLSVDDLKAAASDFKKSAEATGEKLKKVAESALPKTAIMTDKSKAEQAAEQIKSNLKEKVNAVEKIKNAGDKLKEDAAKLKDSAAGAIPDALTKAAKGAAIGAVAGILTGSKTGALDGALAGAVTGALASTDLGKSITNNITSEKSLLKNVAIGAAVAGIASAIGKSTPNPVKPAYLNRADNYATTESIGDLTAGETKALITQLGWDATQLNYSTDTADNLLGKYNFTAKELVKTGYIKQAAYDRYATDAVNYVSSWTNKDGINSRSAFVAAKQIQEDAVYKLLESNYKTMLNTGAIDSEDASETVAGMLSVSYGLGVENALEWKEKGTGPSVNGKTGEEYFNMGRYAVNALSTKAV